MDATATPPEARRRRGTGRERPERKLVDIRRDEPCRIEHRLVGAPWSPHCQPARGTEALDEERRHAWNTARGAITQRRAGRATGDARRLKHARYTLWKNPEDLTVNQQAKLAWVARTDPRLHRAYLLKEGLRHVFAVKGEQGKQALDRWLSWAQRCRIPSFVKLAQRIRKHRAAIDASLEHGLSNGLIESTDTKIRLLTRIAFGFKSPDALVAHSMLSLGGHRPSLPGRATHR